MLWLVYQKAAKAAASVNNSKQLIILRTSQSSYTPFVLGLTHTISRSRSVGSLGSIFLANSRPPSNILFIFCAKRCRSCLQPATQLLSYPIHCGVPRKSEALELLIQQSPIPQKTRQSRKDAFLVVEPHISD